MSLQLCSLRKLWLLRRFGLDLCFGAGLLGGSCRQELLIVFFEVSLVKEVLGKPLGSHSCAAGGPPHPPLIQLHQ